MGRVLTDPVALIGALGGATGLVALLRAWWGRRDDVNKTRNEHVADLAKWRDEMHELAMELQEMLEFYRSMAADFEYQLRSHGIEPVTTAIRPDGKKKDV